MSRNDQRTQRPQRVDLRCVRGDSARRSGAEMTAKKTKKRSEELIGRRVMGIQVLANGRHPSRAHLIYEEHYADGSHKLFRGHTVFGMETGRGSAARTKREKAFYKHESAPHLGNTMLAAAHLLRDIEYACGLLDESRGIKEK